MEFAISRILAGKRLHILFISIHVGNRISPWKLLVPDGIMGGSRIPKPTGALLVTSLLPFFWILFHTGKDWITVRGFAIELLKLIISFILMNYFTAEDFIADFSLFTKKRLTTRGICSQKALPKQDEVTTGIYLISDEFSSLLNY
ncbi:MAG: hypothetical protein RBR15_10185 [Sphaerochaeta sp.]|nr:hypothetical protein [Sphaerochaeta sp.]